MLERSASSLSWSNSEPGLSIMVSLWNYQGVVYSEVVTQTEPHRQGPVLIIGALGVQRPRGAQARAGGREEGEGHLGRQKTCKEREIRKVY